MGFESQSELVEFKVESARFIDIQPRPRADAPPDLERILLDELKKHVEVSAHGCGEGCDCVADEPIVVASREQVKKVTSGEYTAWYRVKLVKYRTPCECMPSEDELPA